MNLLFGSLLLLWMFVSQFGHPCDACHCSLSLIFKFTRPALQRLSPFLLSPSTCALLSFEHFSHFESTKNFRKV